MPDYSDQQLMAILEMGDIGGEERKLAQQQALAQQLRGTALQPSAGKDIGSQMARALQGGMAGYAQGQVNPMVDKIGGQKRDALAKMRAALGTGTTPPLADPNSMATAAQRPPGMGMQPEMPGAMPGAMPDVNPLRKPRPDGMGYLG